MPQITSRNPNTNRVNLKAAATRNGGALKPSTAAANAANAKSVTTQTTHHVAERVSLKDAAVKPKVGVKAAFNENKSKANAENQMGDVGKTKRVSLKPTANKITNADAGKSKTTNVPKAGGSNHKVMPKKSLKVNKPAPVEKAAPATNSNGLDFVIFCDENDELSVAAVQKEQKPTKNGAAEIVLDKENMQAIEHKKTALQDKRVTTVSLKGNVQKTVQQQAVQPSQQIAQPRKPLENKKLDAVKPKMVTTNQVKPSVQPVKVISKTVSTKILTEIKVNVESEPMEEDEQEIGGDSLIIESLKLDESLITDVTLDESGIEDLNKENDPSLMSVDATMNTSVEAPSVSLASYQLETCATYAEDVYEYILARERHFMVDPMYMNQQPDINPKMRSMLIDWLVDVSIEYKLESETVFLAVNYIDRFLSSLTISLPNFQLLGTASLFIASKYEEIYPPEIGEFIYITDDAYSKPQMLSMEMLVLKSLNFDISPPTAIYFLKKLLCDISLPSYVEYFAEVCVFFFFHDLRRFFIPRLI